MADVNKSLYWVLILGMVFSISLFALGLLAFALPSIEQYSDTILMAATVVLLATPVTRTLVGTLAFLANKDMRAAMVAGMVFLVLMFSVFLGFVLHFQV